MKGYYLDFQAYIQEILKIKLNAILYDGHQIRCKVF